MYTLLRLLAFVIVAGLATAWFLTRPDRLPDTALDGVTGDATRGEQVFYAGGCASCHAAPGAQDAAKLVLAGGRAFASDFGTFYAPNISPSAQGIGDWTAMDLANAMIRGVSPSGAHYYPAFPYTSYARATPQDVADLHAFLTTLPASDNQAPPHEVGFPFNIRRALGGWKLLFLKDDWVLTDPADDQVARGRYLVEALGHCAECHTARNALGGVDRTAWLGGAPNPSGEGRIPNITPAGLDWSAGDIAEYLSSGFTPEFDVAGGEMADVIANTAQLTDADRAAIAAYLKAVPPVP
ncbi:c-type cytochrome [Pseudooceanicola aestuarii]|uniref:c-type cytochrome n=1 Tax=Pseudooceanicola aestuarii TaxID=2697319 RepID=UPI0013D3D370|nr:cytochrome c [Pseudooceanicola aestuarii]